jgi:3'-5' exonuclease
VRPDKVCQTIPLRFRDVSRRRPDYLVVDIETVPDTTRWARPESPHPAEASEARRSPSFPPTWAHRVIVIGCLLLDGDYRLRRVGVVGDDGAGASDDPDQREAQLLESFSRFVGKARTTLLTYNGRSFDLPVIALRSLCHGVPLPWYYQDKGVRYRYSDEGHLDLCDWLADHGATRSGSLDAIARLCGLPGKVGVDGSQVEGLHQTGQLGAIQSYCLADVVQTAFVFLRFRLLQGILAPAAYQEAAAGLLDGLSRDDRLAPVLAAIDRDRLLSARGFDLPRREDVAPSDPVDDDDDVDVDVDAASAAEAEAGDDRDPGLLASSA